MTNYFAKITSLVAVGVLTTFLAGAADAPATAPGGGGGGNQGGRQGQPGGPRGGGGMLDEKQRELLRDAMQKNRDEMMKLDEKLRNAQKDLVSAAIAEKYDEKTVREKAEAVSKVQTEMTMLRVKGFSSVAPTLKPEQREQLENSRMGTMMVLGGGFGGGAMGMGGPGGAGGQGGPRRGPGGPGGPGGGQGQ
jgi:Spy/CpxP family protein refolding chaperone